LDGFSAGIDQSLNDPLGKGGKEIFQWFCPANRHTAQANDFEFALFNVRNSSGSSNLFSSTSKFVTCSPCTLDSQPLLCLYPLG
jgi:hypothetical protein